MAKREIGKRWLENKEIEEGILIGSLMDQC